MKAVLNIQKLKSSSAIAGSERHVQRSIDTPNADPELKDRNHLIIGVAENPLYEQVQEAIEQTGYKARKNGVLCLEYMLTAGKEYWDKHPGIVTAWEELNRDWLLKEYGKNCIRAAVHLDETCPHIHAYIVPITKDKRLSCDRFLGGRAGLSNLQTKYADSLASIGLERGIRKSRASHEDIKQFYGAIKKDWSQELTPQEINHQLAHRQILIERNKILENTCKNLSNQYGDIEVKFNQTEDQLSQISQAIQRLGLQNQIYEEINREIKQENKLKFR